MATIRRSLHADHVFFDLASRSRPRLVPFLEWSTPGTLTLSAVNPAASPHTFSWALRRLRLGRGVLVRDAARLPAAAEDEKRFCADHGVRALLMAPLREGVALVGVLGVVCRRRRPDWSLQHICILARQQATFLAFVAQQRAEQERRKSDERLLLAIDATSDGVWDVNLRDGTVHCSDAWYRLLGYEPGEFKPSRDLWKAMCHPEDQPRVAKATAACLAGTRPHYSVELRFRRKDGAWHWMLSRAKVVEWDDTGKPLRVVGTHTDLTAQKKIETLLRQARETLEERVRERTTTLRNANRRLKGEIRRHKATVQTLRQREREVSHFSRHLLAVREEEKRNMAVALHHELGAITLMAPIVVHAVEQAMDRGNFPEAREALSKVRPFVKEKLDRLRAMAADLYPPDLDMGSLPDALRQYLRHAACPEGPRVKFVSALGRRRIARPTAVVIFRTVQEALTNILKHARSTLVQIRLECRDRRVRLRIADNGGGFRVTATKSKRPHLGLRAMREMAAAAKGRLVLRSTIGRGTVLRLSLPLTTGRA